MRDKSVGEMLPFLNRQLQGGLILQVVFEQKFEEGEGMNPVDSWRTFQAEGEGCAKALVQEYAAYV